MKGTGKYRRVGQFKGFLFLCGVIIVLGVLFYTQYLVEQLRMEARHSLSMNIEHYRFLLDNASPYQAFEAIRRIDIPIILTDEEGNPKFWKNLSIDPADTSLAAHRKLQSLMHHMDKISEPIAIEYSQGQKDYFHYGDSNLISQLRLLPVMGIGVVGLFILIGYFGFKNIKDSEQRAVWVGMARETAHQLGTPLSSLLGWMALLKSGKTDDTLYGEMERDISRLEKITARFSQIGSELHMKRAKIVPVVVESVNYYRRRIPQSGHKVKLQEKYQADPEAVINPDLLGWVVENLIRNGIDALSENEGSITVAVSANTKRAYIDISDTGCGIDPLNRRNIFRPGYTTKSRGWGVGLSLARRIIQNYHRGRLFIKESRPEQGTTMRIMIPMKR